MVPWRIVQLCSCQCDVLEYSRWWIEVSLLYDKRNSNSTLLFNCEIFYLFFPVANDFELFHGVLASKFLIMAGVLNSYISRLFKLLNNYEHLLRIHVFQLKEMDDVDILTIVIQEMSKEFPTLMETLLHERDMLVNSNTSFSLPNFLNHSYGWINDLFVVSIAFAYCYLKSLMMREIIDLY